MYSQFCFYLFTVLCNFIYFLCVQNNYLNIAILVGGGRHNTIENNTFISCDLAVAFDDRGLTWDTSYCAPGGAFEQDLDSFKLVFEKHSIISCFAM